MIKSLIDIELGYINTNHPDFISDTQLLLQNSENPDEIKLKIYETVEYSVIDIKKEPTSAEIIQTKYGYFLGKKEESKKEETNIKL
jgi:hypothetical protein